MTPLEKELLEATNVKPRQYDDRQDLLKAICRAIGNETFPDHAYKALSDEAVDWYSEAVKAFNEGEEAPDFEEAEEVEVEAGDEADSDDTVEEAIAAVSKPVAEDTVPTPAKTAAKKAAKAKAKAPAKAAPKVAKDVAVEPKQPKQTNRKPPPATATGAKNRYGIYTGTQLDIAIKMFEKGCTMSEVKKELGEAKYNVLRRLKNEGHTVAKDGTKFTLIHKDDAKPTKIKKK